MRKALQDLIWAAPFATLGTALWIVIAYFFNQSLIDAVTGGQEVTRQGAAAALQLLENLCISRGITMPKLKVTDDDALNAFASGLNQKQYSITVTHGLLDHLDDARGRGRARPRADPYPQRRRADAGDRGRHRRRDRLLRRIGVPDDVPGRLALGRRGRSSGDSDRGKGGGGIAIVIAIALVAVAWLLSVVIRFALSRKREYLADAGSVELTKDPDAMISALRKIEGRGELEGATSAVMEMCIDNPREGFADLFATHPSVESRIAALIQFAGGHDPGPLDLPEERASLPDAAGAARATGARALEQRGRAAQAVPARPSRRSHSAAHHRPTRGSRSGSVGPAANLSRRTSIPPQHRSRCRGTGEMSPSRASAIELNGPSAMFPTSVGRYRADSGAKGGYGKACSDSGGRGQGRRRQDDRLAGAARLFHRPQHPDPRLRHREPEGHAEAVPSRTSPRWWTCTPPPTR